MTASVINTLAPIAFWSSSPATKSAVLHPTTVFLADGLFKTTPLHLASPAIAPIRRLPVSTNAKGSPSSEQKWTHEGSITESLPNGMFRVKLDNQDLIIGYISGKIRKNFVRILPGDRVKVEVSRYDSSRGRIVYRLRNREYSNE